MSILEDIFLYDVQSPFQRLLEDAELDLTADHRDFVYVDGEEGDHGVVRYYDADKQLVAVRTLHGGDSEHTELTTLGAQMVRAKLTSLFAQTISEAVTGNQALDPVAAVIPG